MRPPLSRRGFLGTRALGLAVAGLGGLASCGRTDHPTTRAAVGHGPLIADPDGVLALPSGFSYTVLARSGGTSTLVVDADGRRTSQYTSLAGTVNNCAGGVTP